MGLRSGKMESNIWGETMPAKPTPGGGTGGPPEVRLHGAAAERARALGVTVSISLTHTGRDAGAVAIAA